MSENVQKRLKARVIHKHKTESAWRMDVYDSKGDERDDAFVPENGELIIFDPENEGQEKRFKFGDGKTNVIDLPFTGMVHEDMFDENGVLQIPNGVTTEGCVAYAKAGSAIGIETASGSKSFTIWGLGNPAATDSNEGVYLVDGISMTAEDGIVYEMAVGDDYSCHVCYTNANGNGSRQRSFYGKITAINETEQTAPNGDKLYAISVSPFWGVPAKATFRPFVTNEDGSISELEEEYLDDFGIDQERNTFRIPSKPLLGYRTLGAYAYATGYKSSANTRGAFTFGRNNIADGNYAGAIGFGNEAAYAAFATGNNTKAIGIKSFTQGANTEAYQEAASAMGVRTIVDGFGASGTGVDVVVNGRASNGEGKETIAGMKWTKISDVAEGGTYVLQLHQTFSNEYCSGYMDVDASYTYDAESGYAELISGSHTLTIETISSDINAEDYVIGEKIQGDWGLITPFAVGTYHLYGFNYGHSPYCEVHLALADYSGSPYDTSVAELCGFTSDDLVYLGNCFTLASVVEGFSANDIYSILQTNFDTSYIDVGKITSIDGNKIYVDVLPEWKDAKSSTSVVRYFGVREKPNVGTTILGEAMHAEGLRTTALYTGAHAGGVDSIATNLNTFAHGANAKATSRHAIALGDHAEAKDAFSAAIGQYTKTGRANQIVVGKYNEETDAAFVVGWGTSSSRANVFEVETNGNIKATSFNGYTIKKSVPSDAKFTDTTYEEATTTDAGLMAAEDKVYIDTVRNNLDEHTVEANVPADAVFTDTTYNVATNTQNGLMPKEFKSAIAVGDADKNFLNSASGIHAVALGRSNKALQKSAVATGIHTIAYGFNSLTNGDKSIAFGNNSVAFGSGIQFTDDVTSASDTDIITAWESGTEYNVALGNNSEVHGRGNLANAYAAFVCGTSNRADSANQFVAGKYNDYSSEASFIVGDGSSKSVRSNAFEVFGKTSDTSAYATVGGKTLATEEYVQNSLATIDLTDYITRTEFNEAIGDIETALNSIIAIQNQILGG